MKKHDYEVSVPLKHDEFILIGNRNTGEATELKSKTNYTSTDSEKWIPSAIFKKDYVESWQYLKEELSAIEFKAAYSLALLAKANTNSLQPLNDDTTYTALTEILDVSKNKVDSVLKRLWNLGVYGKFEVVDPSVNYTKYWLLNPYLSFSGQVIKSDIGNLFKGTRIAREYIIRSQMKAN